MSAFDDRRPPRILLVDDEEPWHHLVAKALAPWPFQGVQDGVAALAALRAEFFDLVLLDRRFESPHNRFGKAADREGEEILRRLHALEDAPEVLVLTAHGDVEEAVRCMRLGARDFASKDRSTLAGLKARILHCIGEGRQARDLAYLRREGRETAGTRLIGGSAAMEGLRRDVERFGASDRDVLLLGETGTGKELVASALHAASPRRSAIMRQVNCATWTGELLGAELFGIEAGVATGVGARPGQFELADGGTLFLDELGSLPSDAQGMLLRILETRRVERLGGRRSRAIDVRIISASNRPLEGEVEAGSFREDLYYRMRGLVLDLPPLRDRLEDLPALIRSFLDGDPLGRDLKLSDEALAFLRRHPWPGNVRELKAVTLNAAVYAAGSGCIGVEHLRLPPVPGRRGAISGKSTGLDFKIEVARRKIELFREAWDRCQGKVSRLHELLGLPGRYAVRRELLRLQRDHPELCDALPERLRPGSEGEDAS